MDFKKVAVVAIYLTVAMLIVNYALGALLGQTVQTLFATVNLPVVGQVTVPNAVSPISGTVGAKVFGWLQGVVPISFEVIITLYISAFITLLIGGFLVEQFDLPNFKGKVGTLVGVILYGSIPLYLLVKGVVMPSLSVMGVIGLVAYTFVAAWGASWLADATKQM